MLYALKTNIETLGKCLGMWSIRFECTAQHVDLLYLYAVNEAFTIGLAGLNPGRGVMVQFG